MTATSDLPDIDPIEPAATDPIKLASGHLVTVRRLRVRSLFKLMRVVTHGAGMMIPRLMDSSNADEFAANLTAVVVMAIPDAEQEAIEFVRSICSPVVQGRGEEADRTAAEVYAYLDDPEPDDLISIIERVVQQDKDSLVSLGKRLQEMVGTTPPPAAKTEGSPGAGLAPST